MSDSVRDKRMGGADAPPAAAQERPSAPGAENRDEQPRHYVPADAPEAPADPTVPESELAPGDGDDSAEEHAARLEHDLEDLSAKAQKADEYLELAQRTKADFENFRKRASREASAAQGRGVARLAKELLPAVDNLDRALEAGDGSSSGDDLLAVIKLVHAEVLAALARVGVERFDPVGEPFDPTCHEAVAQQPAQGAEAGTVVEVYQRGYRLGDAVIRPARVVVAG